MQLVVDDLFGPDLLDEPDGVFVLISNDEQLIVAGPHPERETALGVGIHAAKE
jgi:hypothetical protein